MTDSLSCCQNCQNQFMGNYCNLCGERLFEARQRKITVLFAHLIDSLFDIDGKLLKTIRYFFFKPGFLAYEHWRGVRKPYMTPAAFFVLVNVIFFIFSPITDFALPLSTQAFQPYSSWVQPIIDQYLSDNAIEFEQMAVRYDTLSSAMAKSLVILSVPFLVPFIWLVNSNREYYLLDHSVSGLYIYSFVLVWPMVLSCLLTGFYWIVGDWQLPQGLVLTLLLSSYFIYSALFQHHMYQNPWWACLLKGFVITLGIAISHFIYRYIQFCIVWWQVT